MFFQFYYVPETEEYMLDNTFRLIIVEIMLKRHLVQKVQVSTVTIREIEIMRSRNST